MRRIPLQTEKLYYIEVRTFTDLSPYSTESANEINTKKHEMYMANARNLRWDPKQPICH